jgi:NitT/TauT family transport system substrate-binding protein
VTFTHDPLSATLEDLLADGVAAGTTEDASLDGIYDLRLLNAVLADLGRDPVSAAGLGQE